MMIRKHLLALILVLTTTCAALSAQQQTQPQPPPAKRSRGLMVTPGQQHPEVGQRVFEQNCSRCHTTPDGFSPHISGTVAMHMRVRASLSQADAEALLRFLNP
jgi:cytochrome c5